MEGYAGVFEVQAVNSRTFFSICLLHQRDLGMTKWFKSIKLNFIVSRPGNPSWKRKDECKFEFYRYFLSVNQMAEHVTT